MQPLMVDFVISLDGHGAADGWPGLWGMQGPEYLAWLDEQEDHAAIMGATTYRLLAEIAQTMPDAPGVAQMTAQSKLVCSSTLQEPLPWANTQLIRGEAVEAIREVKRTSELPLRTLGSLSLCRSLLQAGLVDRYRVVVFPVINGATGRDRIFDGYPDVRLDLVDHRVFDGRLQLLEYVPTVLDGPPSAA